MGRKAEGLDLPGRDNDYIDAVEMNGRKWQIRHNTLFAIFGILGSFYIYV